MTHSERSRVALALVHFPVVDRFGILRATSVTPLNIHDLARAARTFGVSPFYVVTPLLSQQALTARILRHWREGHGAVQNPSRREALRDVTVMDSLNEAAGDLFRVTGSYPILVGTGARAHPRSLSCRVLIEKITTSRRPWLLLFGTGWGLSQEATDQCDFFLEPVRGGEEFNHLSVRSAVSIILDRLFGK
jgi:hypothetical protein